MASAYYESKYRPKSYESEISPELIFKVGSYKTQMYEQNLAKIKSMQSSAVNIKFLRQDAQSSLDAYNDEISKSLNDSQFQYQDLSDLSAANKYIHVFDKLSQDTELMNAYKHETEFRNQIQNITSTKGKKDSIYADDNFIVWQNEEGGLNDYLSASTYKNWNKQIPTYVPYYDTAKEFAKLGSDLKELTKGTSEVEMKPERTADGKIVMRPTRRIVNTLYRSEEDVKSWFDLKLSAQAKTQMAISAKAQIYRSGKKVDELATEIYDVRKDQYDYQKRLFDNALKDADEKIKLLKSKQKTPEIDAQIQLYSEEKTKLEEKQKEFNSKRKETLDDLKKYNIHQLANEYAEIAVDNRITLASRAVSGIIMRKLTGDAAGIAEDKNNLEMIRLKLMERKLDIEERKNKGGSGEGAGSSEDNDPNSLDNSNVITNSAEKPKEIQSSSNDLDLAHGYYNYSHSLITRFKEGSVSENDYDAIMKSLDENISKNNSSNPNTEGFDFLKNKIDQALAEIKITNPNPSKKIQIEAIKQTLLEDEDEVITQLTRLETKRNYYQELRNKLYNESVAEVNAKGISSTDSRFSNEVTTAYRNKKYKYTDNIKEVTLKTSVYTSGKDEENNAKQNVDAKVKTLISREIGPEASNHLDLSMVKVQILPSGEQNLLFKLDPQKNSFAKTISTYDESGVADKSTILSAEAISPYVVQLNSDGTVSLLKANNAVNPALMAAKNISLDDNPDEDEIKEDFNKVKAALGNNSKEIFEMYGITDLNSYINYLNSPHAETRIDSPHKQLKYTWNDIQSLDRFVKVGGSDKAGLTIPTNDNVLKLALDETKTTAPISILQHKGYIVKAQRSPISETTQLYFLDAKTNQVIKKLEDFSKTVNYEDLVEAAKTYINSVLLK